MRHAVARIACSIAIDVTWVALQSVRLGAAPDASAIAFACLVAFHLVALAGAVTGERMARTRFAIQRALEAAVRDRQALLDDLFPPAVVQAVLAGEPVPPLVSEGVVVLFCDLAGGLWEWLSRFLRDHAATSALAPRLLGAGFTRMSSALGPADVMRGA